MIQRHRGSKSLDRRLGLALRGEPLTPFLMEPAEPRMMPLEQGKRVVSGRKSSETTLANCRQKQRITVVWFLRQQHLERRQCLGIATLTHQGANS